MNPGFNMAFYRSTNPAVLHAVADKREADNAFLARISEQLQEWGFSSGQSLFARSPFDGSTYFLGPMLPEDANGIPAGWRSAQGSRYCVPRLNTKLGKENQPTFATLQKYPHGVQGCLPGMPGALILGGNYTSVLPGFAEVDGVIWVSWTVDPESEDVIDSRGVKIDKGLWDRVPLSEYFALVEAGHDPLAA